MPERYWLVRASGRRTLIDPTRCDLEQLAESAREIGARLVMEPLPTPSNEEREGGLRQRLTRGLRGRSYEPPVSAIGPLFLQRLDRVHEPAASFHLDVNPRPPSRVLGGYYQKRKLVRIYTHDRETGRRPLEELFDTFLHEVAHHLEYTEPRSFNANACERVPGRMHSELFWRILGALKERWAALQPNDPQRQMTS